VETIERGGVLLRFADGGDAPMLAFVPAAVATRLAALGSLVRVPGAHPPVLGVALAEGSVVTVLRLGDRDAQPAAYRPDDAWPVPGADRALLCRVGGIDVALTGGSVVATGLFDAAPEGDGILWRGQMVPTLDVRALYGQAEAATWAGRATSARPRAPSHPAATAPHGEEAGTERATWLPRLPGDDHEKTEGTR
jgi:hypothetical protein